MMTIMSGRFDDPRSHHKGWFRVFSFGLGVYEVWIGSRWFSVSP